MSGFSSIFMGFSASRHGARLATLVLSGLGMIASPTFAQGPPAQRATYTREETRGILEDYSNSLQDRSRYNNSRRPTSPAVPAGSVTPEMKLVRPFIHSFSDVASQLTYSMNDQIARIPALRSLYSDALTVSAEAVALDRHAAQHGDHNLVLDDFEQLDVDWRELAYKMQNVRGLPTETRDLISLLTSHAQQIRKALNTHAQINRQEVSLEAAGLAGDLQNLMEDINIELGRTQLAQQLLLQSSRARQQVLAFISMCRDSQIDPALLVREYKSFEANWQPVAAKLQAEDNRYLERNLRRISLSVGRIHDLLLLPQTMDKTQLVYLTASLKKDIDEFFTKTSLLLVIHLPKATKALGTADQFYGVCEHFVDQVNRGADFDDVVDSFRYIEEASRSFSDVYGAINSDKAVAVLQRIEQSVSAIRTSLHLQREDFDRNAAGELAASIAHLTEQLELATRQWLTDDPQSFSTACRQEVATLATQSASIQRNLLRGVPVSQLQREIDDTYEHWRTAYKYLVKCQTEDRPVLGRLSGRLTPALVELRTMISQSAVEQTALRPVRR